MVDARGIRRAVLLERVKERLSIAIAFRLPRRVVAWCLLRAIRHATRSGAAAGDISSIELVQGWLDDSRNTSPPKSGAGTGESAGPAPSASRRRHDEAIERMKRAGRWQGLA